MRGCGRIRQSLVPLQPIIHQYVEIKRSRRVEIFTHASVTELNFKQGFEQIMGGERGFNQRHCVDEIRLIQSAPAARCDKARNAPADGSMEGAPTPQMRSVSARPDYPGCCLIRYMPGKRRDDLTCDSWYRTIPARPQLHCRGSRHRRRRIFGGHGFFGASFSPRP